MDFMTAVQAFTNVVKRILEDGDSNLTINNGHFQFTFDHEMIKVSVEGSSDGVNNDSPNPAPQLETIEVLEEA